MERWMKDVLMKKETLVSIVIYARARTMVGKGAL